MSDSDVLQRAAKALREAHTGERAGSGFTRARIMNTLHRERRRRILRWAVFSPLVSLLLVGSAWAQSTGNWPVIWHAVTSVFGAQQGASEPSSRVLEKRPRERAMAEHAPGPAEPAAVPPEPVLPDPGSVLEPAPAPPSVKEPEGLRPAPRAARSRTKRPQAREPSPRAQPAAEPEAPAAARELGLFRAAHDLHFRGGRPRDAIAAYQAYLREYPRGRFVPEARYNAALDHIELGERDAAREALEPFANGAYGGYRQKEARELLDALH